MIGVSQLPFDSAIMGSRRRNRANRAPDPPAEEAETPDPELLVPPERWVIGSVTPSDRPVIVGTPRHPGLNADQITPKHPDYGKKIDDAMTLRYHPVSVNVFQSELLKGHNLGAKALKQLGNIQKLVIPTKEFDMYPVLVRR